MPKITFIVSGGERREIDAPVGKTVLEIAWDNDLGIEGACEGSLACSTCHVVVDQAHFDALPEPTMDEEDMLDLAWGVQPTSRLGCQIEITEACEGMELIVPTETVNQMG